MGWGHEGVPAWLFLALRGRRLQPHPPSLEQEPQAHATVLTMMQMMVVP